MKKKILILVVAPNDSQIGEAVQAWKERNYDAQTHPIVDPTNVVDSLIGSIDRYSGDVRILFTESAWGSIPYQHRHSLIDRLWIDPKVRWFHWAKKQKD